MPLIIHSFFDGTNNFVHACYKPGILLDPGGAAVNRKDQEPALRETARETARQPGGDWCSEESKE